MSSTNINVGIFEGRNSSRVLKPPGGGHSQIFGRFDEDAPKPKARQGNTVGINACFAHEDASDYKKKEEPKTEMKDEIIMQTNGAGEQNGNGVQEKENGGDQQQRDEEGRKPPQRVRVPPGGFSSGFW